MTSTKLTSEQLAQDESDPEHNHGVADGILCELLRSLGHGKVVKEFEKLKKYYA